MASLHDTMTSADIGQQPKTSGDLAIDKAQIDATTWFNNPQLLLKGLPKPNAFQSAVRAGLAGLQAGQAIPTATPEVAALTGALTGLGSQIQEQQQAQQNAMAMIDMAPIDQFAPEFVKANPQFSGLPMKFVGQFAYLLKQQGEQPLGTGDLDFIKDYLRGKRYSEEDIEKMAPTYVGRTLSQLKSIAPTERLARKSVVTKTRTNDYGIPVVAELYDEINKETKLQPLKENSDITKQIQKISGGKNMVDYLYKQYTSILSPKQQEEFARAMAEGYDNQMFAEGGEAGFIQRVRGVVNKALARPAFDGKEGQKLQAFMSALEANIPMIARSLGHTGVLTELDVMKSFGIAPDVKGTALENVERQRIYNNLVKTQVDSIMGSYVPYYGEQPDMTKLYKRLGISDVNNTTPKQQVKKKDAASRFAELRAGGMSEDDAYKTMAKEGGY